MRNLLAAVFVSAVFLVPVSSEALEDKPVPNNLGKIKAGEAKAPPTVDELVRYFDTIVFKSEFKSAAPSTLIKKWTGPLRVAIRNFEEVTEKADGREVPRLKQVKVKKPHLRFIQKHLNSLIRATGLKTEDAKKTGKDPNFYINFVPRQQMANPHLVKVKQKLLKRMAAQGGCFFLMWADRKSGNISKAVIVVNSERLLIRINHCLLEEMTQSLGLPNDSNLINPSIFSDRSRRTDLTRTDLIILKTLYDERMKVGLLHEKAISVAADIIGELNASIP